MAVISNDTATKMAEYEKTNPAPMSQDDNYPYDYLLLRDSGITKSLLVEVLMWRLRNENKLFYAQLKLTVSKWPFDAIPPSLQDILSIIEEIEDLHYFIKGRKDENGFLIVSWDRDDYENMLYGVIGYGKRTNAEQILLQQLKYGQSKLISAHVPTETLLKVGNENAKSRKEKNTIISDIENTLGLSEIESKRLELAEKERRQLTSLLVY